MWDSELQNLFYEYQFKNLLEYLGVELFLLNGINICDLFCGAV